jgi:hypothetical protein
MDRNNNPDIEIFFVVGGADRIHVEDNIVHLPCDDQYDGLVEKTKHLCQYVLNNYDFDYLFKCDDDTFLCVDRLYQRTGNEAYVGTASRTPDGRPYAEGGAGYRINKQATSCAAEKLDPDSANTCEDTSVGDVLRLNGVKLTHDSRFCQSMKQIPSMFNKQISCHLIRTKEDLDLVTSCWEAHPYQHKML